MVIGHRYVRRLLSSPLGMRVARGAAWSVLGAIASRGMALVSSIVIARILGKEGFGELGILQNTIGMLLVFASAGMGITATKYVAELRHKDPHGAGRMITLTNYCAVLMGLVVALPVSVFSSWLSTTYLYAPHLSSSLRVVGLLLVLQSIQGAQTGTLCGLEAFRAMAGMNVISGLASFPIIVSGACWGGLDGSLWGMVISGLLSCSLLQLAVRSEMRLAQIPTRQKWRLAECATLWKFTMPIVLSSIMVGPVHWVCSAMLFRTSQGHAAMGTVNATNQWFSALLFLPAVLGQSVMPLMAEQIGMDARHSAMRLLKLSLKVNSLLALPIFVLACASPWIMELYGPSFSDEWPTLVVVLVTAAVLSVLSPVGQALTASGKGWTGVWMNLGWAIVYVGCTQWLLSWGSLGLATARLMAYSVHALSTGWYAVCLLRRPATLP